MSELFLDEKAVYLAMSGVFHGQRALIRKSKTISKTIEEYSFQPPIKCLVGSYGLPNLSQVCRKSLDCEGLSIDHGCEIMIPGPFRGFS
jgi:hypothetical protein